MNTTVQLTFDFGSYGKRMAAGEDQFLKNYEGVLENFVDQSQIAFASMSEYVKHIPPLEIEPRLRAVMLNGMICGRMMRLYPDTCRRREYNRASFLIGGVETFIKKLDENLLPSNAISKHNLALRKQLAAPNGADNAVLWMGYTIDENWKRITGFYVANILEEKVQWSIDIEDYLRDRNNDQNAGLPVQPITPVNPGLKKSAEEKTGEQ